MVQNYKKIKVLPVRMKKTFWMERHQTFLLLLIAMTTVTVLLFNNNYFVIVDLKFSNVANCLEFINPIAKCNQ